MGCTRLAQQVRQDFPVLQRQVNRHPLVYFDNAATTQKPREVIEALHRYYEEYNANVHRGVHTLAAQATEAYEEAHKAVARFINAPSWREIVFTRNATESLNLVAYAWGLRRLRPGDRVLTTIMEHHSNLVPWQQITRRVGAHLDFADITDDGRLDLDDLFSKLTEQTRVVTLTLASNVLGTVNPVKEIARRAHEVGALVVVDAAQAAPHMPIDVQDLGVDFLAVSGHKMMGPTGIGFLWGREDLLEDMDPFLYGGEMIHEVWPDRATWNELPWKFEAGTPNIAGGIGLKAAVDYLSRVGMDRVEECERELTAYALEKLLNFPGLTLYGPRDVQDRLGVLSFTLEGIHSHDIASILDLHGIAIRSGSHCAHPLIRRLGLEGTARISLYLYNTPEEVDRAVEALHKVWDIFHG